MYYTIGLDAGTNSTGFSLLDENNRLIEFGVDTFPMGNKEEKGIEKSRNAERRGYRGARRNRFRYHLRRAKLQKILKSLGMLPTFEEVITAFEIYQMRKNALEKQISLTDLGRFFLLFNKYRGFKSSRKEPTNKDPEKEKEEGAIKTEISWLKNRMTIHGCKTVGQYFFKMFEKSQELYERGEWHNPDEPYDERGLDTEGFFSLVGSRGIRREGRHLERALLEDEFDKIWAKQHEFYSDILTDENFVSIKLHCIFYQRPLKSPKKFIGKCSYEKRKQCAPLSSLIFQEFRVLKQLLDIRLTDKKDPDIFNKPLDDEQRGILFLALQDVDKLSFTKVRELLKLPKTIQFNSDEIGKEGLMGNHTRASLRDALKFALFDELQLSNKLENLWHALYMSSNEGWIRQTLSNPQKWAFEQISLKHFLKANHNFGFCPCTPPIVVSNIVKALCRTRLR